MSAKPLKSTLHGMLGKTVIAEDETKVRIIDIAHSMKYANKAVINGEKFINYLELYSQVGGFGRPTKEEINEFNKIAIKDNKRREPKSRGAKENN